MVIFWIAIGLLFVYSVILLSGRGGRLIARYNAANREKKSRYDEKKLSRAFGVLLLFDVLATIPLVTLKSSTYTIVYFILIFVSSIAMSIYAKTRCISSKPQEYKKGRSTPAQKIGGIIVAVVVSAVMVGTVILVINGGSAVVYTVSADGKEFNIDSMYGRTINVSDIKDVELKTYLPDKLSRTNGYGGFGPVLKGYCSSDIGPILVFVTTDKSAFIYMTTTTDVIILSDESDEQTNQLYEKLQALIQ